MERAQKEMGAQSEAEWRANQPGAASSSFTGAGNTLSGESVAGAPVPQQPTEHTITFWQNGFTVDDGPLRTREDPASDAFLAAVNRGAWRALSDTPLPRTAPRRGTLTTRVRLGLARGHPD